MFSILMNWILWLFGRKRFVFVIFGAPGAGKGTVSEYLRSLGIAHISTGDLFRKHLKAQTELGKLAQTYMSKGELVPDDVTIAMVRDAILTLPVTYSVILLDGFPRNPAQANALQKMLYSLAIAFGGVINLNVREEILVERMGGRWTCRKHGHIFNEKTNPPTTAGVCDFDGSELYQRDDDKSETVKNRVHVYVTESVQLLSHFARLGLLHNVDGEMAIEAVRDAVWKKLHEILAYRVQVETAKSFAVSGTLALIIGTTMFVSGVLISAIIALIV